METVRGRSIEARSRGMPVPNLENEKHLSPGESDSPVRRGLYPQPPDLARHKMDPRSAFWVIKHEIKMTGMPAFGASHDEQAIWSIVVFINRAFLRSMRSSTRRWSSARRPTGR